MDKKEKNTNEEKMEKVPTKSVNSKLPEPLKASEILSYTKKELRKNLGLVLALVILGLAAILYNNKSAFIAATVEGKPIFRWQVTKMLEKQLGDQALNTLIEKQLIENSAASQNITASDEDVNAKIKTIEDGVTQSGQTLEAFLTQNGMTEKDFRDQVKQIVLLEKLLQDKISVSEEEITQYIEENKESFPDLKDDEQGRSLIRESLMQNKMNEAYMSYISDLRTNGNVNVLKDY